MTRKHLTSEEINKLLSTWYGKIFAYVFIFYMIIQYIICAYTFFTTIYLAYTLYNSYIYYADHSWCYYPMIVVIFSLYTTIVCNFIYTFYMIHWLDKILSLKFTLNFLFSYTGRISPLSYCLYKSNNNYIRVFWFAFWSLLKIIDFSVYINSSMVIDFVMLGGIRDIMGWDEYIRIESRKQTIEKRCSIYSLISLLLMDIPQGVVTIYILSENNQLDMNYINFGSLRSGAILTLLRIILSCLFTLASFIKSYFFTYKNTLQHNQKLYVENPHQLMYKDGQLVYNDGGPQFQTDKIIPVNGYYYSDNKQPLLSN